MLDYTSLGSSLSLRSFARFGSSCSVKARVWLGGAGGSFIESSATDSKVSFHTTANPNAGGGDGEPTAPLSIHTSNGITGGTLHGLWQSDAVLSTSDRRLKENVRELLDGMKAQKPANLGPSIPSAVDGTPVSTEIAGDGDLTEWLLRELRPVSYKFKSGMGLKDDTRFGFIEQDIRKALPEVTRELPRTKLPADAETLPGDSEKARGVMYEDLIAVLTKTLQHLSDGLREANTALTDVESRLKKKRAQKRRRQKQRRQQHASARA